MSDTITDRILETRIQNKYDTAEKWTTNNPKLFLGEIGFESDTGKFKIGDGNTEWNSLSYAATQPNELDITNGALDTLTETVTELLDNLSTDYALKTELDTKQAVISDLDTIIEGAALGKTALQEVPSNYNNMVNITYYDLKALRDTSQLVPGQQYRIIDYKCTTTQENTRSAEHQFDIIVTADDEKTLNENARAVNLTDLITGPHWINSNILPSDIEIMYKVYGDSATSQSYPKTELITNELAKELIEINNLPAFITENPHFGQHAQETEYGSSYVYGGDYVLDGATYNLWWEEDYVGEYGLLTNKVVREKDYFAENNLAAWEIKYCLDNDSDRFTWADSENGKGVIYYMKDEFNNEAPYDFKNIQFKRKLNLDDSSNYYLDTSNGIYTWCYTFGGPTDRSVNITDNYFSSNIIKSRHYFNDDSNKIIFSLPDNVFLGTNFIGACSHSNKIGTNCYNNTFGYECCRNILNDHCYSNTLGNSCYNNTFGNSCYNNTLGDNCYANTFGNSCSDNKFGNNCITNTFANYCQSNVFGNYCENITFGNNCTNNIFGSWINTTITPRSNAGSDVGNTGGDFGGGSSDMGGGNFDNVGDSSGGNINTPINKKIGIDYCRNIILEANVRYVVLSSTDAAANDQNYLQNIIIHQGLKGAETILNQLNLKIARNLSTVAEYYPSLPKTYEVIKAQGSLVGYDVNLWEPEGTWTKSN